VDYRKDPSVAVARDAQVTIVDDKNVVKCSTRGWELCCEWKDSSTSWQELLDLKESHPLQVAEFAFAAQIADEPVLNWWSAGSSRRETVLSPWLSVEVLDTTNTLTSMGLRSQRQSRRHMPLIAPLTLSFGTMRLRRR
jgi:hypothetical protein